MTSPEFPVEEHSLELRSPAEHRLLLEKILIPAGKRLRRQEGGGTSRVSLETNWQTTPDGELGIEFSIGEYEGEQMYTIAFHHEQSNRIKEVRELGIEQEFLLLKAKEETDLLDAMTEETPVYPFYDVKMLVVAPKILTPVSTVTVEMGVSEGCYVYFEDEAEHVQVTINEGWKRVDDEFEEGNTEVCITTEEVCLILDSLLTGGLIDVRRVRWFSEALKKLPKAQPSAT